MRETRNAPGSASVLPAGVRTVACPSHSPTVAGGTPAVPDASERGVMLDPGMPNAMLTARERRRIAEGALALLRHNRRRARHPRDGRLLRYTCPSPGHYPFQWF